MKDSTTFGALSLVILMMNGGFNVKSLGLIVALLVYYALASIFLPSSKDPR